MREPEETGPEETGWFWKVPCFWVESQAEDCLFPLEAASDRALNRVWKAVLSTVILRLRWPGLGVDSRAGPPQSSDCLES